MNFVYDDGGRKAAGFSDKMSDCVTRTIAIATGLPYLHVYFALSVGTKSERVAKGRRRRTTAAHGVHTNRTWFKRYMKTLGWKWTPTMGIGTGCRIHLRDGELPMGRLIVSVSRHLVAVVDGVIHDTHDCSRNGNRCVYGYWSKI